MLVLKTLLCLEIARWKFQLGRTAARLASPRRVIATIAAVVFFSIYIANGFWVLSLRAPTDPQRLYLWLSGGMIIYAIYHALQCVYRTSTDDLEFTPPMQLWIGGGPVSPQAMIVSLMIDRVAASTLKTMLMMIALWVDSPCPLLLAMGILASMITVDLLRLIIVRALQMLPPRHLRSAKVAITSIVVAMTFFVLAHVAVTTAPGSSPLAYMLAGISGLGTLAATDTIQSIAFMFWPAAHLAIADSWGLVSTWVSMIVSIAMVPGLIWLYGRITLIAQNQKQRIETEQLRQIDAGTLRYQSQQKCSIDELDWQATRHPCRVLLDRQWLGVKRYAGTITTSLTIPVFLCLSPILSTDLHARWLFVVGGIGFCTTMLAPAALKIDFRRDLKRMSLLRSLPVSPLTMVASQLILPIAITMVFQAVVLVVAGWVLRPGSSAILMWAGMLPALAIAVFAVENALFLAYPHHTHAQGVAMLVRTKLTFLGKSTLLAVAVTVLLAWAMFCRRELPEPLTIPVMVAGSVIAAWAVAAATVGIAVHCWRRFDLSFDVPPA
jgi:hypothetical protein